MNDDGAVIARRLAFLERELDGMGDVADDAEHELRLNPTDFQARRRLEAIYALAGKTWTEILELRARQPAAMPSSTMTAMLTSRPAAGGVGHWAEQGYFSP